MSSRLRRRSIFGQCPPVNFVATRASDGSTGASTPETITWSSTPTAGNLLLLVYTHAGADNLTDPPDYETPSGWTRVGSAYNFATPGADDRFASTVVYTKVATGSESGSFSFSQTTHGGRGRARIYEYTPGTVSAVETYDNFESPTSAGPIDLAAKKSTVFVAVAAAGPVTGSPSDLSITTANGFTSLLFDSDTLYKYGHLTQDGIIGSTADLPVLTNTNDGGGYYPYAGVAVALSRCASSSPPPEIPNAVAIWWASDLALTNGDAVTSWVDRVGGLVAADVGSVIPVFDATGLNGRPAVAFNEDVLSVSIADAFSTISTGCVVAVVEFANSGNNAVWASADTGNDRYYMQGALIGDDLRMQSNNGSFSADVTYADLTPPATVAIEWVSTGSAWQIRVDNSLETLTTSDGTNNGRWWDGVSNRDNFTIGASIRQGEVPAGNRLDGKIAFLMVTDGELDTTERTDLYAWISAYYGI